MASGRKNAADAARAQATQALVGGIGSVVGGLASGGAFGEKAQEFSQGTNEMSMYEQFGRKFLGE